MPTRREFAASAVSAAAAAPAMVRASVSDRADTLRFLVLGDWGRDGDHYQRHVAGLMDSDAMSGGFDFMVTTGDNFYKAGVKSAHDRQWLSSFEHVYSPWLRSKPWFAVAGNHDWGGNVFAQLDRSGRGGWRMPWLWYDVRCSAFGRPDVHLFFIDTVVWNNSESWIWALCGQRPQALHHERQRLWLEQALGASSAPIKIVFGHHPIYSISKHSHGKRELGELDDLLTTHGVTAYVCGHDHCLYHISAEKPGSSLHYVCSGGGSEELHIFKGDPQRFGCVLSQACEAPNPRWHQYIDRAGYAVFEIARDDARFRFVDRAGNATAWTKLERRSRAEQGQAPPDPAKLPENLSARATSLVPCTSLARILGI